MDLQRFLGITVRWSALILFLGVAAATTAFFVSQWQQRMYMSEAIVLIGSLTDADPQQQLGYQQLAETYARVATTGPVLGRLKARLSLGDSTSDIGDRIAVRASETQPLILIHATAPLPDDAASLANAIADEVTALSRVSAGQSGLATVVQPGVAPSRPSSPNVMVNTAIAAALGLTLGVVIAVGLSEWRRSRRLAKLSVRPNPTQGPPFPPQGPPFPADAQPQQGLAPPWPDASQWQGQPQWPDDHRLT